MKVLNFGSLNLDYVYSVDHMVAPGETLASFDMTIFCGGKGLNQSIALARAGVEVYHAGMIGDEGESLLNVCKENGVKTGFVKKINGRSGHTIIQVDKTGQNCILLYGGSNQNITRDFVDDVLMTFSQGDVILLQNEINCLDYIIDTAHKKGMIIILNPSPFNEALKTCDFSKVSIFLLNEVEGEQITGKKEKNEILFKLRESYPEAKIVLTLGAEGAIYQDKELQCFQEIYKVPVVDTTAAGDTFTGYLVSSIIEGKKIEEGMRIAAKAASIAVSRKGATSSIPNKEEVILEK